MNHSTAVVRPRPNRAIVAGFCASAASALVLLFAHILAKIIYQGTNGSVFGALIDNNLTVLAASNLYLAIGLHFIVGIGLSYLYMKLRPSLPKDTLTAGFLFLTPPFLASVFLLFPLTGGGFFGMEYGAGLLPGLGSLVLHAVYGFTMIGLYEKAGALSFGMVQNRGLAGPPRAHHRHAAHGILYGTVVGAPLACVMWFLMRESLTVPGLPLEFSFMAMIFFFSSMGLLIGFWTGTPARQKAALKP